MYSDDEPWKEEGERDDTVLHSDRRLHWYLRARSALRLAEPQEEFLSDARDR